MVLWFMDLCNSISGRIDNKYYIARYPGIKVAKIGARP